MKYCVSARQENTVLNKADEIMLAYKDKDIITDLNLKNPNATIILQIPKTAEVEWVKYQQLSQTINLIFALEDIGMYKKCKAFNIKYYWAYPITSYYELRGIKDLGVSYFLLGAPLTFDLEVISKLQIPIRMIANLCYDSYIPRKDGINGVYIRPEDVQYYEKYVDTLEFYTTSLQKEATLLKIYKEDQNWPGNLNLILENFNCNVDNRAIIEEFAVARMQCRQNCMRNGTCRFCYTAVEFSKTLDREKDRLKNDA